MAWRDSRRNRGRLLLFVTSIIIGIAALVAIQSFSENLQRDIAREARTLLGADLLVQGGQPAADSVRQRFRRLPAVATAEIWSLASMAYFPRNGGSRLVQVRAQNGAFPFYGKFDTQPAAAADTFLAAASDTTEPASVALVERTLLLQFNRSVGDTIRIGNTPFLIIGELRTVPGRAGIAGSVAPVVYIPLAALPGTELVRQGSLVWYQYFFRLADGTDSQSLAREDLEPALENTPLEVETAADRQQQLGNALGNMRTFLQLVAFIALLLGSIGVASAVHIYLRDKMARIAVLRCLGLQAGQAFRIYFLQVLALGLAGGIAGAILGSVLQLALPPLLASFLPIRDISTDVSPAAILTGMGTGLGVTLLFSLLPLLAIRRVSPLATLRASLEQDVSARDPLRWGVYSLILLFMGGLTYLQTDSLAFPAAILLAFLVLAGFAKGLVWSVRRFFPTHWTYTWRQSLANLYRPNNQTMVLIVTIGLGTALLSTLFLVQDLLLRQIAYTGANDLPNMIIFDIQTHQKEDVARLATEQGLPLRQLVPIVTMRLETIDGVNQTDNRRDTLDEPRNRRRNWVYEREYRVTYRDSLIDTETLVEGTWHGSVAADGIIYVSIAENIADDMQAGVGSRLVFNVQGTPMETVVGSIRKVDFRRVQTNFLVVFPTGVLEQAPQFHVIVSRTDSEEQSAGFQQALVRRFPNVSVIDLTQILRSVSTVLDKVSFVIRFMALFSILTGLIVLVSSVVLSKFQRIRESVLLRTLGAHRSHIIRINLQEYFLLGLLASLTGVVLSLVGGFALATWSLEIPFDPDLRPTLLVFLSVTALTMLIGSLHTRSIVRQPPLEVLRKEDG
ncbi:MAG: hypothetical protein RLY31_2175 [Bacteroidota bacterium]